MRKHILVRQHHQNRGHYIPNLSCAWLPKYLIFSMSSFFKKSPAIFVDLLIPGCWAEICWLQLKLFERKLFLRNDISALVPSQLLARQCFNQYRPLRLHKEEYIDGLVQDCSNSSALAMELLQSCTKPLMYTLDEYEIVSLPSEHAWLEEISTKLVSIRLNLWAATPIYMLNRLTFSLVHWHQLCWFKIGRDTVWMFVEQLVQNDKNKGKSKLHTNGPLWGESSGDFPSQMMSNVESISMSSHNLFHNFKSLFWTCGEIEQITWI